MNLQAVCAVLLVALATCRGDMHRNDSRPGNGTMDGMDTRPETVLMKLREGNKLDQLLAAADSNNNQRFTQQELSEFLFRSGDVDNNGRVSWAEFMDSWRSRAPSIPPPVLVKMFYLLDSLNADGGRTDKATCKEQKNVFSNVVNVGDGELRPDDLTSLASFGANNDTIGAVRQAVETWIREAARLVNWYFMAPFEIGEEYSVEFDYDRFFTDIDNNNDGIISQGELEGLLTLLGASATTSASRQQWFAGATQNFKQSPYSALVFFDYLDSDNNNRLDAKDLLELYKMADANMDERVTKQELFRFMQRKDKLIRRMLGLPVKPFMYDCPQYYWDDECGDPDFKATIATMDADNDFDGKVTRKEFDMLFDRMGGEDGKVDRVTFIKFYHERYGQDMAASSLEFDAADTDGDGYVSGKDMDDAEEFVCVCEFRMHLLAGARAAMHLAEQRKKEGEMLRMKYHVRMSEAVKKAKKREPMGMDPWHWMTMNGKPAKGECKACNARANWGMDMGDKRDENATKADDMRIMKMLMQAVEKMKMNKEGKDKDMEDMAAWLLWKMREMMEKGMGMGGDDKKDKGDDMEWKQDWMAWKEQEMKKKEWDQGWKPWKQDWKPWKQEEKDWGQGWKMWKATEKKNGWGQEWGPWKQGEKNGWGQGWKQEEKGLGSRLETMETGMESGMGSGMGTMETGLEGMDAGWTGGGGEEAGQG